MREHEARRRRALLHDSARRVCRLSGLGLDLKLGKDGLGERGLLKAELAVAHEQLLHEVAQHEPLLAHQGGVCGNAEARHARLG